MIKAAVRDLENGHTWRTIQTRYRVDPDTVKSRAAALGLAVPEGKRRTIRPMRLRLPDTPAQLGYLAGILDGEGSIVIRERATPRAYVFVLITNTSDDLRTLLAEIGGSFSMKDRTGSLGTKPCWSWMLRGRLDCLAFLQAVEPFMVIKRAKACEALRLLEKWGDRPSLPTVRGSW